MTETEMTENAHKTNFEIAIKMKIDQKQAS